jgi:hypothetical protein
LAACDFLEIASMAGRTTSSRSKFGSNSPVTRNDLSPQEQELLRLLQFVRYGRIHQVPVRDGQPCLDHVQWTEKVKVLGENDPHPAIHAPNFALQQDLIELFRQFRCMGHGVVNNLEIRNGIPFSYELLGAHP